MLSTEEVYAALAKIEVCNENSDGPFFVGVDRERDAALGTSWVIRARFRGPVANVSALTRSRQRRPGEFVSGPQYDGPLSSNYVGEFESVPLLLDAIQQTLRALVNHEIDEWLRFNGKPYRDPHPEERPLIFPPDMPLAERLEIEVDGEKVERVTLDDPLPKIDADAIDWPAWWAAINAPGLIPNDPTKPST